MNDQTQRVSFAAPASNQTGQFLIETLRQIVGGEHVLTSEASTQRYRTGFRFGLGKAAAVVRPGNLVEQWRVVKACVEANRIVIMQAANTGLTGGSNPDGDDYDREIVIISTMRMKKVQLIHDGKQVICFPGATLDQLEQTLAPIGREPHSVIGSSCIGASVFGGICNNSGGALVQRGPAYTEMAIFGRLDEAGRLELVNHLGIQLGSDPEQVLGRLDRNEFTEADVVTNAGRGHDDDYVIHVRDVDADTPARFNADPKRLHEVSGCAGKLILFAVRLDTFPSEGKTTVFYIGTNNPDELTAIRHHILAGFSSLPISGEYLHRDAFDVAAKYGKDTFIAIRLLGTKHLPALFSIKGRFDTLFQKFPFLPGHLTDRLMQLSSYFFPNHLPKRMREYRNKYVHHLLLRVAHKQTQETKSYLDQFFMSATGGYFQCDRDEGEKAFLHRFAAAGAAVRYRAVHGKEIEDIVALDVALRRNDKQWEEHLPPEIDKKILIKMYYGHFLCHVLHQDYIVKKGNDCLGLEHDMWKLLDKRGAEYPAEHNVGHLYNAKPELKAFYRTLDPCNQFNPGVGRTTKLKFWKINV